MAIEEDTILNASFEFWEASKGTGRDGERDWADKKAWDICSQFLGIDGYQNHGSLMEHFNWPAIIHPMAAALRKERGEA